MIVMFVVIHDSSKVRYQSQIRYFFLISRPASIIFENNIQHNEVKQEYHGVILMIFHLLSILLQAVHAKKERIHPMH
jgi:hypothetical protein